MNPPTVALQPGSPNTAAVKQLQDYLVSIGIMTPAQRMSGYGTYGPQTTAAVLKLQQNKGVDSSTGPGFWGPRTIAAITSGTPDVATAGKTAVQMSDGTTRYYGGDGIASDASGNPLPALKSPISAGETKTNSTSTDTTTHVPPAGLGADTNAALNGINTSAVATKFDPSTPEGQAAMDAIDTSMYDQLMREATATTAQEHQAAQDSWTQLKSYIEKNLNITLKDDSMKAWDQLQSYNQQYGNLNMEGSGIQNEAMDKYLNSVRANDEAQRLTSNTKEEEQQANYYQNYATDDQIAAFAAAHPDKAQAYGLVPADGLQSIAQRTAAMKTQFPTMSDAAIKSSLDAMYDKNGYVLSGLNKKFMTGTQSGIQTGSADPTKTVYNPNDPTGNTVSTYGSLKPNDTGILDIAATQKQDQLMNARAASASAAIDTVAARK